MPEMCHDVNVARGYSVRLGGWQEHESGGGRLIRTAVRHQMWRRAASAAWWSVGATLHAEDPLSWAQDNH